MRTLAEQLQREAQFKRKGIKLAEQFLKKEEFEGPPGTFWEYVRKKSPDGFISERQYNQLSAVLLVGYGRYLHPKVKRAFWKHLGRYS